MTLLHILDIVIFTAFIINTIYLAIFSIASLFKLRNKPTTDNAPTKNKRIAMLVPAYKEDSVIRECVDSCIKQEYPKANYDIVVISDRMSDQTNDSLNKLPIKLIKVHFENSTKSKALNFAMQEIGDNYDIALIMDADNTISPDFLSKISNLFYSKGVEIVQAHRCAKNINTPLALLDAVSEEINNSIFRKGHAQLGLSAALIGSGMAFDYALFKKTMLSIDAIGGFDRALELTLLQQRHRIYYLENADVLDEKVQRSQDFSRQRRRWLSAQLHYLSENFKYLPLAIKEGKWDFCDKVFQQMSIPRVMLLGLSFIIALTLTFTLFTLSIKWWIMFAILTISLTIAIPRKLFRRKLLIAIMQLPYFFIVMVINVFRLKGANKKFIHTKHTATK